MFVSASGDLEPDPRACHHAVARPNEAIERPATIPGRQRWDDGVGGNGYGITQNPYTGANLAVAIDHAGNLWGEEKGSSLLVETSQVCTNPNTIAPGTGELDRQAAACGSPTRATI
jgi:hypothetical protein